jgi:hypothetical protein
MWVLMLLPGLMCVVFGCLLLTWGELGDALVGVPVMAGGLALTVLSWRMRGDVLFQLNRQAVLLSSPASAVELADRFRRMLERGNDGLGPIRVSRRHPHAVSEQGVCFWAYIQLRGAWVLLKCSGQFRPAEDGGTAVNFLLQPSPWHYPIYLLFFVIAWGIVWLSKGSRGALGETIFTGAFALMLGCLFAWLFVSFSRGLLRNVLEGIMSPPRAERV